MPAQTSSAAPFATRIALDADARGDVVRLLNARLADAADLYSQTKHAHWNVKGNDFYQLHKLFDELAEIVEEHADALAERATALGGFAQGTLRRAAAATSLPELGDETEGMALVRALADRYAAYGNAAREGIERAEEHGDMATADLLTDLVRDADKALYFLEAHLQRA